MRTLNIIEPWTGHRRGHSPHQVAGRPGLILSGSASLTSTVLEHGLADEAVRVGYPVLLGTGKRFLADGTPARSFELVSTQAMPSGIVLGAYKVAGP